MKITKLDKNMVVKKADDKLVWYDAKKLTVEGKGWQDTEEFFHRLPSKAKNKVREPVWELSKCTAGITVRFVSNTPTLAVKWDGNNAMVHMAATGVSGLDLYVKQDGHWRWLAVGRPEKKINEVELFKDINSEYREYMLYLPLYSQIHTLELAIPPTYEIVPAPHRDKKPLVFYGTSITQGGCASRPGMCYTAIIGRRLDCPVINLGFSGNGIMEPEVIDLLCELNPSIYILDCLPNMQAKRINEVTENAICTLRKKHSDTPIIMIDNILYTDAYLISSRMKRYTESNRAQYAIYEKLIKDGMRHLYYIKDSEFHLIGTDGEATVDGTHLTDLGYMRFSDVFIKILKHYNLTIFFCFCFLLL